MDVNLEEYPNRHKGKFCVIISDRVRRELDRASRRKGTSFSDESSCTAPVGTILYVCAHKYGWTEGHGPNTARQYALAKVTHSRRVRHATTTQMAWFTTRFALIDNG